MERTEWLKKMRSMAEVVYDHLAPAYWVNFVLHYDPSHRQFMEKLLARMGADSYILDAACGGGLYDGILLEAGHRVLGIDQSDSSLDRARQVFPQERFPGLRYEKVGLQEMDYQDTFDGAICMDAMEHICPEDWPGILVRFQKALKPGGLLYVTVDAAKLGDYRPSYERARAMGLPVVFGEVADELDEIYAQVMATDARESSAVFGERLDLCVYHYHPTMQQVHAWYEQAGLVIEEESADDVYVHVLARKPGK